VVEVELLVRETYQEDRVVQVVALAIMVSPSVQEIYP
jgi:hypothetical protein